MQNAADKDECVSEHLSNVNVVTARPAQHAEVFTLTTPK